MKVKGGALGARAAFVKEHFGEDGWRKVMSAMPAEYQSPLRLILASSWYPFELAKKLDEEIVRVLGNGDRKVFERIGAASADRNLNGTHRHFLKPGDPQAFMEQAQSIYGFYYDTGRREYSRTSPTSGVLTTYDAETFSAADCLTVTGWYVRALDLCGAKAPQMKETACRANGDASCRYEVSWKM